MQTPVGKWVFDGREREQRAQTLEHGADGWVRASGGGGVGCEGGEDEELDVGAGGVHEGQHVRVPGLGVGEVGAGGGLGRGEEVVGAEGEAGGGRWRAEFLGRGSRMTRLDSGYRMVGCGVRGRGRCRWRGRRCRRLLGGWL